MGIVWEAYHKGVPLLGVPENPIDIECISILLVRSGRSLLTRLANPIENESLTSTQ